MTAPGRAAEISLPPAVADEVRYRILTWKDRYGLLPMIAMAGILPFFPVTPLLGVVAGGLGLHRIAQGHAPEAGRTHALAGIVVGLFWLVVGFYLIDQVTDFVQSAPFIPAPLKWFWNWGAGTGMGGQRV